MVAAAFQSRENPVPCDAEGPRFLPCPVPAPHFRIGGFQLGDVALRIEKSFRNGVPQAHAQLLQTRRVRRYLHSGRDK